MSLSPWLKSPFTDLTGAVISHQWFGNCADMEMRALDCLEAYGLDAGVRKCDLLLKDFKECTLKTKQFKRMYVMRWERNRQVFAGERSKENKWAEPPTPDSYFF